MNNIKIISYKW